jgi:hypothetical protein
MTLTLYDNKNHLAVCAVKNLLQTAECEVCCPLTSATIIFLM